MELDSQSESLDGSQIPPTLPINRSTGALVLRLLALGAPLLYLIFHFPHPALFRFLLFRFWNSSLLPFSQSHP